MAELHTGAVPLLALCLLAFLLNRVSAVESPAEVSTEHFENQQNSSITGGEESFTSSSTAKATHESTFLPVTEITVKKVNDTRKNTDINTIDEHLNEAEGKHNTVKHKNSSRSDSNSNSTVVKKTDDSPELQADSTTVIPESKRSGSEHIHTRKTANAGTTYHKLGMVTVSGLLLVLVTQLLV